MNVPSEVFSQWSHSSVTDECGHSLSMDAIGSWRNKTLNDYWGPWLNYQDINYWYICFIVLIISWRSWALSCYSNTKKWIVRLIQWAVTNAVKKEFLVARSGNSFIVLACWENSFKVKLSYWQMTLVLWCCCAIVGMAYIPIKFVKMFHCSDYSNLTAS